MVSGETLRSALLGGVLGLARVGGQADGARSIRSFRNGSVGIFARRARDPPLVALRLGAGAPSASVAGPIGGRKAMSKTKTGRKLPMLQLVALGLGVGSVAMVGVFGFTQHVAPTEVSEHPPTAAPTMTIAPPEAPSPSPSSAEGPEGPVVPVALVDTSDPPEAPPATSAAPSMSPPSPAVTNKVSVKTVPSVPPKPTSIFSSTDASSAPPSSTPPPSTTSTREPLVENTEGVFEHRRRP
jgi:hypothetical protein